MEELRSIFTMDSDGNIAIRINQIEACEQDALGCNDVRVFEDLLYASVKKNACNKESLTISAVDNEPYLELLLMSPAYFYELDYNDVDAWNNFFGLPDGTFTSVQATNGGMTIKLKGATGIGISAGRFADDVNILSFVDTGCITYILEDTFKNAVNLHTVRCSLVNEVESSAFLGCTSLTNVYLPELIIAYTGTFSGCTALQSISLPKVSTIGNSYFSGCSNLTTVSLPLCHSVGSFCFNECFNLQSVYIPVCLNLGGTTGDDNVFRSIAGQTITITIPSALMTNNGGNPDGDIQYLQSNNTVTVIQV